MATRPSSLQQAASAVFAVTAVVPLLIFVWTLHRLGALSHLQSQVGLGLALGMALLGFFIFRRLMGRMSELIQGLGRAVDRGARAAPGPRSSSAGLGRPAGLITEYHPPVAGPQARPVAAAHATPPASGRVATITAPATPTAVPRALQVDPSPQSAEAVPGLGMIQEVDDLSRAMAKLWMAEAAAYQGRRVALSVMNARVPVTGTLVDLTQEGLLIDQDGAGQVAVSYSRLSGIDAA